MATYYVDFVGGDDTNNGTTTGTPWQHCHGDAAATDNAASTSMSAGDTILFKGGVTYASGPITIADAGSVGNYITYDGTGSSYGSGAAVIDGDDTLTGAFVVNANYIEIKGFEIFDIDGNAIYSGGARDYQTFTDLTIHDTVGSSAIDGAGIYTLDTDHVTVHGCTIYNMAGDCLRLYGAVDLTIEDCTLHDGEYDGAMLGASGTATIDGNTIYNFDNVANHGDGIVAIGCPTGSTWIIRNNTFYGSIGNIALANYTNPAGEEDAGDFYIYNNLIYNPSPGENGLEGYYNGIQIDCRYNDFDSVTVVGNTLIDMNAGNGGIGTVDGAYVVTSLVIKNNLLFNSISPIHADHYTAVDRDYNLYYNENRAWSLSDDGNYYNLAEYQAAYEGLETHSLATQPTFVSGAGRNYRSLSDSVQVDTGIAVSAVGAISFASDADGVSRPKGNGWDIGAYEKTSGYFILGG